MNTINQAIGALGFERNPVVINRAACGQGVSVLKDGDFFTDTDHGPFRAWGICDLTCNSRGLSMAIGVMPPHTEGSFHAHDDSDTALYIHSGRVIAEWLDAEGNCIQSEVCAGEFIYIPRGTQHRPVNPFNGPMAYIVSRNVGRAD